MQGMGEKCPFEFNFEAATFNPGDVVSYRVTGSLTGFPFDGTLPLRRDAPRSPR
jgi:hypothetical protein